MIHMSKAEIQCNPVKQREEWLRRLAEEYEKLDAAMPVKNILPEEAGPAWVQNLEREVADILFPVANLKEPQSRSPKQMGAILGHQCASGVWMMEWFAAEAQNPKKTDGIKPSAEKIKEGEKIVKGLSEDWYEGLCNLAKLALSSCVDQSYEDMKTFLLAYATAFAQKPHSFGVGNIGHSAFPIYVFMLMHWRIVERLNSVRELHEMLVKVFGASQVGELKRIEKICQRIGLHYRKPGRPKKLQ